jgi:hypothetical protein
MKLANSLFIPLLLSFSGTASALVDYSDEAPSASTSSSSKSSSAPAAKSMTRMPERSGSKSLTWKADYSLITNYETMKISEQKIGVMNIAAHVQTPFDVYFEGSYWNASTDVGSQAGNPKLILGFNWLRFGNPSEEARFDLYGGARLASKSELATSRTDKIFGAETTKRFGTFGLGIGYEMTLAGKAKRTTETQIGNIQRLSVSGGWMVSNDIQFEIEADNYTVRADETGAVNSLKEKVNFSTLSPKLNLGLAPAVHLEMGARFRMKKAKEELKLANAGLFDLHGALANSLYAGLNLSI